MIQVKINKVVGSPDMAQIGEVRTDGHGRVVLITSIEREEPVIHTKMTRRTYYKAVVLKEGRNGIVPLFDTVPMDYASLWEITKAYPHKLEAEIEINEVTTI